jgi:hypothetical protein
LGKCHDNILPRLEKPATILSQPARPALDYGYIGARNDTTQQSGMTPDKDVEIKNVSIYASDYTETDTTGMLTPPTI